MQAYTFELGKCYEETIRERQLRRPGQHRRRAVRARSPKGSGCRRRTPAVDGRGRRHRARRCRRSVARWPVDGRTVGDRRGRHRRRGRRRERSARQLRAAGLVPLLVAAAGGPIWPTATCRRSARSSRRARWSSTRSSWPALPPPAPDARRSRDAKAGAGTDDRGRPAARAAGRRGLPARQGASASSATPSGPPPSGSRTTRPVSPWATSLSWLRRSSRVYRSTGRGTASHRPADPEESQSRPARPTSGPGGPP